ncbi:patatin-like phospholipase family protein [Longirhabdus pacifica]|uniref:patatin-like phospholipase family protein n=1 Tax=Longirhabdus pacifica TaxID=2305227 RepID=UPI001009309E|nr:patatin-like phospholipase family protein [Longirhabdus pacifica]
MRINAVFEGGGVKAIALVGAIKAAEEQGVTYHQTAGTSSGAIVASFLSAGYKADEMKEFILESPFQSFLKKTIPHYFYGIGPALRVFLKKGMYRGDNLEDWIREKLAKKGLRTFGDLGKNKLRIIASDITRGKMLVLPDDIAYFNINPDKFEVAKAVRMSTSLPFFFDAVLLRRPAKIVKKEKCPPYCYIVDGAILSNFPLHLFDEDCSKLNKIRPTIGFQLVGKNNHSSYNINGPLTMFQAMISTMMEAQDEKHIEKYNRFRTIKIPTLGVKTTQFDITKEKSLQLYQSGYRAGKSFFKHFSHANYIKELTDYCSEK